MYNKFFTGKFLIRLAAFFVFGLISFAGKSSAQVTIDNVSSNGASDNIAVTSLTFNHTVNACTNCVLYVGVSTYSQLNAATARVTSVTYGTRTLTAVGTQVSPLPTLPTTGNSSVEIYRLIAPPTGTALVTINLAPVTVNSVVGGAISLNGVSQTTPNGAFASSSGNSDRLALSVSGSVSGDLALGVGASSPNAGFFGTPTAPQIEQWNGRPFFGNSFDVGFGDTKSPTGANTQLMRRSTNAASWAFGGFVIKQNVQTAATGSIQGRIITPSGRGVSKAFIRLTDSAGNTRTVLTNPFGYFRFGDVPSGETYVVNVDSKRYSFLPRTINIVNELNNLDFIAQP